MAATREEFITSIRAEGMQTYRKAQQDIATGWGRVSTSLDRFTSAGASLGAATAVLGGYALATKNMVAMAIDAERVQEQFNVAMKNNLGLTGQAAESMKRFAKSLSAAGGKSPFDDEAVVNAVSMLSTFKLTEDQLRTFTPILLDMAEGYRKATGQTLDLQQASVMLGTALQTENAGRLRRVGIILDENTIATKGFANALRDELTRQFGGQAAAAMDTAAGKMAEFQTQMGNVNKALGTSFLPVIKSGAAALSLFAGAFTKANDVTGGTLAMVVALGGAAAASLLVIAQLKHAWLEVTGAAGSAAAAQMAAAGAGSYMGGSGGIAGMGRAASKVGGIIKGANPYVLAGSAAAGIAGASVGGKWGNALSGAATGAAIGSIIPGVGTAIGAGAGALIGGGIGYFTSRNDPSASGATNSEARKQTQLLEKIANNTEQGREFKGGGVRFKASWNQGDLERAMMAQMAGVTA